jgi:hypothetical protein
VDTAPGAATVGSTGLAGSAAAAEYTGANTIGAEVASLGVRLTEGVYLGTEDKGATLKSDGGIEK